MGRDWRCSSAPPPCISWPQPTPSSWPRSVTSRSPGGVTSTLWPPRGPSFSPGSSPTSAGNGEVLWECASAPTVAWSCRPTTATPQRTATVAPTWSSSPRLAACRRARQASPRMHSTTSAVTLAVAVFLASAVESVEALTIIVAIGALVVLVAARGPALVYLVPVNVLRAVVGGLLLVFGLQWLRKAVLRAVGLKAKHDEDAIFKQHVDALTVAEAPVPAASGRVDATGFVVAFKGTFLEGMEVIVIVLGLGGGDHQLGLASAAAGAAILVVAGVGVVVARQLAGVPENAMKTVVGLMLTSFGTFWAGEGLGIRWPGSDLAILVLVGIYALVTWALVVMLRPSPRQVSPEQARA